MDPGSLPTEHVSDDEDAYDPDSHAAPAPKASANDDAPPMPPPQMRNNKGGASNTGPKGVIADYNEAKARATARRIDEAIKRERMLNKMAVGDPVLVEKKETPEYVRIAKSFCGLKRSFFLR
jgi:hypothetical protein